ncbi:ribosome hibernation-promoting factor, HPF/YfiA family [Ligilactobacillus saerimneri]|uniref:Ribosome hibernation promoting factor n=2 Tax=Ligilactobacillus saerimneri TaxID=228229 RepID=M5J678_9LACO|nr:ribosome-associated translation inhibitor RaiA [Ligilactobacillus saerimneri]EKW99195.1 Ribosome-associated factor Y [Ligilactobacillus saerimneri 30a]KRL73325.1 ribosome-associated factor y [Ligilactobacillus saerimneri DSM 16049]MBU5310152.1 ribosome-associated translation inhibitor RaiA [Ligilactobacillus saerimneri]MCZ0891079.1 ribosome-associated translation inhibitor RaiA [Ligilactobacillus saerimneri]MDI9206049.1 ribosome-associated translation inhibitor RaiA [Ligilactobacillus saeri
MLKYNVRGENIEVTSALREYVEKKISKLEKFFEDTSNSTAHVNMKVYSDKNAKVEVTIPLPYLVLRAEETSPDMYASVDLVTDKLERQIRKYKTKVNRKSREKGFKNLDFVPSETEEVPEKSFDIVRTKQVSIKPMDSEEAILQMDMLGHDFFIYQDAESDGINIVYRRRDGRYGLIEASDIE